MNPMDVLRQAMGLREPVVELGDGVVRITRDCPFCRGLSTVVLGMDRFLRWEAGEFVQDVWPELDAAHREEIINGTHVSCGLGEEEE